MKLREAKWFSQHDTANSLPAGMRIQPCLNSKPRGSSENLQQFSKHLQSPNCPNRNTASSVWWRSHGTSPQTAGKVFHRNPDSPQRVRPRLCRKHPVGWGQGTVKWDVNFKWEACIPATHRVTRQFYLGHQLHPFKLSLSILTCHCHINMIITCGLVQTQWILDSSPIIAK